MRILPPPRVIRLKHGFHDCRQTFSESRRSEGPKTASRFHVPFHSTKTWICYKESSLHCTRAGDSKSWYNRAKKCWGFLKLHEHEWAEKTSVKALNSLAFKKHNKPECLPVTEDLLKLKEFQLKKMQELTERLEIFAYPEIWRELATICLSRVIVFKKRRSGEASRLRVDSYNSRPNWSNYQNEEITTSLSPQEKELCKRYCLHIL